MDNQRACGIIPFVAGAAVDEVATRNNKDPAKLMTQFLQSDTYSLLLDIETGLYAVGYHVISNMFEEEIGLRQRKPLE